MSGEDKLKERVERERVSGKRDREKECGGSGRVSGEGEASE